MSRSRKKNAIYTISKAWDKFKEHTFRQKTKQFCQEAEFDPDADWEEANYKKMGDWGTRCGFSLEPGPDDSAHEKKWYEKLMRK